LADTTCGGIQRGTPGPPAALLQVGSLLKRGKGETAPAAGISLPCPLSANWCYARTTTKNADRTRSSARFDQGRLSAWTTAIGSLLRFRRGKRRRSSVGLPPSTRGRIVAVFENANYLVDCLQGGFPGSAEEGFFDLRTPTEKDSDKSGVFGLRRVMSRGSCLYPARFRQTLLVPLPRPAALLLLLVLGPSAVAPLAFGAAVERLVRAAKRGQNPTPRLGSIGSPHLALRTIPRPSERAASGELGARARRAS
jgi:hypothetical protein